MYTQNIIEYALKVHYFANNIDAWVVACKNRIMYLSAGETYWFDYCSTVTDIAQINCNHELFTTKTITGSLNNVHFIPFFLSLLTIWSLFNFLH